MIKNLIKNLIIHLIIKFLMSKNKYLIYRTYLSRNGNKKPIYYKFCNLESLTQWNHRMHLLSKYYCKDCYHVFFRSTYYNTHINGVKHKNTITCNKIQKELNN